MKQLNVRIPIELFKKLKAKAALEGMTLTVVVERLIRKYIKESDNDNGKAD